MIYSGTKSMVKQALVGVSFEVQGTDLSEVDEQVVLEKCLTFK
jgi:hypothetical protein